LPSTDATHCFIATQFQQYYKHYYSNLQTERQEKDRKIENSNNEMIEYKEKDSGIVIK
jgi:uncharacterized membrane protein